MGCVLSLPGAQVAGRSLRLFCSGTARVNGTKCDKSASTPAKQKSDLVTIKYVGPVNKGLLMRQGVMTVSDLTDRFHTEADAQADKMVRYLQGRVGIKSKHHCNAITEHIRRLPLPHATRLTTPNSSNVTLCVEGNISAGKSTFLDMIRDTISLNSTLGGGAEVVPQPTDSIAIVPEPVGTWQNLEGGGGNILDAFYQQPERYAYTFQNYVFLTRCMQERNSPRADFRLLERSVFSDRMVFVRAVHQSKYMSDLELSVYNSWFDPMVRDILPGIVPDGFIYLRAPPDTCSRRMHMRQRSEEAGVPLDYLTTLHEMHEDWLNDSERPYGAFESGMLVDAQGRPLSSPQLLGLSEPCSDGLPLQRPPPDSIKDLVVRLSKRNCASLHDSIVDTPALVLDCAQYDLRNDLDARREYAQKVQTYFDWVKSSKEVGRAAFQQNHPGAVEDNLSAGDRRILRECALRSLWANSHQHANGVHLPLHSHLARSFDVPTGRLLAATS